MQIPFEHLFPCTIHTIGMTSPASLPDSKSVDETRRFLESRGLKTILAPGALKRGRSSYCCGTVESRLEDFHSLLHNPEVDLILCTRGGYGSAHLLPHLDFDLLRERNLPVYGFSDISALHLAMLAKKAGIPVCAPMADGLLKSLSYPDAASSFRSVLRKRHSPLGFRLTPVCEEQVKKPVEGPLIPSNLTVMTTLCGTPWMPSFKDAILALEDVNEEVRVLDRHLTHLIQAGIIDSVRAVVFGNFTHCGTKQDLKRLMETFANQTGKPVFQGFPYGHEHPKYSYLCGTPARIEPHIPRKLKK